VDNGSLGANHAAPWFGGISATRLLGMEEPRATSALSQLYLNEWTFFDSADLAESCHNRSKPNSDC
jgi:hypothetical protein